MATGMRLAPSDCNTHKEAPPVVPSARNLPLQSRTRAELSAFPLVLGVTTFVRLAGLLLAGLLLAGRAPLAVAQSAPPPPDQIKPLGGERYQIGKIIVDRKAGAFTAPGKVIHIGDAPLEYLAVGRAGPKGYESLLELDVTGTEFNLACILLGLDNGPRRRPEFQFDVRAPEGPRVTIALQWNVDGNPRRIEAQDVLKIGTSSGATQRAETVPGEWIYTGSFNLEGKVAYAADVTGTIIGFVHDPASIIEHRAGLGIGAYGSVQGDEKILPPLGSGVDLIVTVAGGQARNE
jgi:hypothetical protein